MSKTNTSGPRFNSEAFYVALDKRRRDLRISWREVSRQAELSTNSLGTTLGQGAGLNADNLARLMAWLGETDLKPYITEEAK